MVNEHGSNATVYLYDEEADLQEEILGYKATVGTMQYANDRTILTDVFGQTYNISDDYFETNLSEEQAISIVSNSGSITNPEFDMTDGNDITPEKKAVLISAFEHYFSEFKGSED